VNSSRSEFWNESVWYVNIVCHLLRNYSSIGCPVNEFHIPQNYQGASGCNKDLTIYVSNHTGGQSEFSAADMKVCSKTASPEQVELAPKWALRDLLRRI
jgi:hypothetical protein